MSADGGADCALARPAAGTRGQRSVLRDTLHDVPPDAAGALDCIACMVLYYCMVFLYVIALYSYVVVQYPTLRSPRYTT